MLGWIIENTLLALILVGVCIGVGRVCRSRPAMLHMLWLLVMVRLVLPPITINGWPPKPIKAIAAQTFDAVSNTGDVLFAMLAPQPTLDDMFVPIGESASQSTDTESTRAEALSLVEVSDHQVVPGEHDEEDDRAYLAAFSQSEKLVVQNDVDSSVRSDATSIAAADHVPSSSRIRTFIMSVPWTSVAISIWILGACVLVVRQIAAGCAWRQWSKASNSTREVPSYLHSLARELAASMHMRTPCIRISNAVVSPVVVTLGRSTVLWPSLLTDAHSVHEHRAALAHELAHLKRRDHVVAWFEVFAVAVCWWHPLMWYARRQMRKHAELACDAWAVWVAPHERGAYARSLLSSVERTSVCVPAMSLGLSDCNRRMLERRLHQIMVERTVRRIGPLAALIAAVVFAPLLPSLAGIPTPSSFFNPRPNPIATYDAEIAQVVTRVRELKRADSYYQVGKWRKATDLYQSYLDMVKDDSSVSSDIVGRAQHRLGNCLVRIGMAGEARSAYLGQLQTGYAPERAQFGLACCDGVEENITSSIERLHDAISRGFHDVDRLRTEPSLDAVRNAPAFQVVMRYASTVDDGLVEIDRLVREGNYPAAGSLYKALSDMAPRYGALWERWAAFHIEFRLPSSVIECSVRQIELNHNVAGGMYSIAWASMIAGDPVHAIDSLREAIDAGYTNYRAIETNPDFAALAENEAFLALVKPLQIQTELRDRAKHALSTENTEEAHRLLSELLATGTHTTWPHGWCFDMLGNLLLRENEPNDAIDALLEQISLGYAQHNATYNLACAYAAMHDMERALSYLDASVDLGFKDVEHMLADGDLAFLGTDARFHLIAQKITDANALEMFGSVDWDDLEDNARALLENNTNNGRAWLMLGWAQLRHRELDAAMDSFQQQAQLGFAPHVAMYNIACAHALAGRVDEAFPFLQRAIELGMNDAKMISTDADLWQLRSDPRFDQLLERTQKEADHRLEVRGIDPMKSPTSDAAGAMHPSQLL